MIRPTDPPKKIQKNSEIPSKGHPRARTLLNLKTNFQISFSQYAKNVGTPLFRSMRQAHTEIIVNGQKLETVTSFKYLGSVITDEGSKLEILSRTAQTTAAL